MRIILLSLLMILTTAQLKAQSGWFFTNEVSYGLHGAGDRIGYILDFGVTKELNRRIQLNAKLDRGDFRATSYDVERLKRYVSTSAIGLVVSGAVVLPIGKKSYLAPDAGITLRSHRWVVLTGNAFFEYGDKYVPANSEAIWNDKTIGYSLAIPFVWRYGGRIWGTLGPVYQNDTKGYSFFGASTGLKIRL